MQEVSDASAAAHKINVVEALRTEPDAAFGAVIDPVTVIEKVPA